MTKQPGTSQVQDAIAATLRAELAARKGMTQRQIAERIGLGTTVLNRYFQGTREIPSPILFAITDAMGLDIAVVWDAAQTAYRAERSA